MHTERLRTEPSSERNHQNNIYNNTQSNFSHHSDFASNKLYTNPDVRHDIAQSNPLLYNLGFNPIKHKAEDDYFDSKKLDYLKRLSDNAKPSTPPYIVPKKAVKFFAKLAQSQAASRKSVVKLDDPLLSRNPTYFFQKFAENSKLIEDLKIKGKASFLNF